MEVLAATLDASRKDIEIESGHVSPSKTVTITGMDDEPIPPPSRVAATRRGFEIENLFRRRRNDVSGRSDPGKTDV